MHYPSRMVGQCSVVYSLTAAGGAKSGFSQLASQLHNNVIISQDSGSSWRGDIRKRLERDCTNEEQQRCTVESVL